MNLRNLHIRSQVLHAIRDFFFSEGFTEVETPVRIPAPALETFIDSPPSGRAWLRASPELHMKRLLAEGLPRLYQIGPCFRAGECGSRHNPEFTLLEWYRAGASYTDILKDTEALVTHVFQAVSGSASFGCRGQVVDLSRPWHCLTVREAFRTLAGWDPVAAWDPDRFDLDLVAKVEPGLPRDKPCVLTDYPAPAAALARLKPHDPSVAERWELYVGGLELANAYGELCDAGVQRAASRRPPRPDGSSAKRSTRSTSRSSRPLSEGCPPAAASRWAWTGWSCSPAGQQTYPTSGLFANARGS